jgi:hypothetical protein
VKLSALGISLHTLDEFAGLSLLVVKQVEMLANFCPSKISKELGELYPTNHSILS